MPAKSNTFYRAAPLVMPPPHSVNTLLKFSKYISKYSSLDMYAYISLAIVGGCCCCVQLLRYIRFDSEKFDSQLIALLTA